MITPAESGTTSGAGQRILRVRPAVENAAAGILVKDLENDPAMGYI